MSVWKKWFLEKVIAEEIENYEPTQLNTLHKQFYTEIDLFTVPSTMLDMQPHTHENDAGVDSC